jgi:hypothetical protein
LLVRGWAAVKVKLSAEQAKIMPFVSLSEIVFMNASRSYIAAALVLTASAIGGSAAIAQVPSNAPVQPYGASAEANRAAVANMAPNAANATAPNAIAPAGAAVPASAATVDAEKEEIWNSPDMLRARAWLKDYCSKSVKVTPEMAKQYESELANMTPNQMRIWLMKFDEEEQQRQQQNTFFQQQNEYMMQRAMAAHRQTQQAYSALSQAQSAAAQNAQQQFTEQREQAQQNQENKQLNQTPYYGGPYGGAFNGPYGGYGPWNYGGGVHYHYHLY